MSNLLFVLHTDPLPLIYVVLSGVAVYYALKGCCRDYRWLRSITRCK